MMTRRKTKAQRIEEMRSMLESEEFKNWFDSIVPTPEDIVNYEAEARRASVKWFREQQKQSA